MRYPLFILSSVFLSSALALFSSSSGAEDALLQPSSSTVTITKSSSPLPADPLVLDDPSVQKELDPPRPPIAPQCLSRLPTGAFPGVYPQAAKALGQCQAIAFAARSYAPAMAVFRALACSDPSGAKKRADDLALQATLPPSGAPAPTPPLELSGAPPSPQELLADLQKTDSQEIEICLDWDKKAPPFGPSLSVFAVGDATFSGNSCKAALMEVTFLSGRYALDRNYFLAGLGSCQGSFSSLTPDAFLSRASAAAFLMRTLRGYSWSGPSPDLDSLRPAP